MKYIFLTLLVFTFMAFLPAKKVLFKGKVTYTEQYCGGAAPTPQIIEEMDKEKPFANRNLCVKAYHATDLRSQPVITKVTTDENGAFSVSLDKGKYALVIEQKIQDYSKGIMGKFGNSSGCQNWQNTADMTFTVGKKSNKFTALTFHEGCNPCTPPRP